MGVADDMERVRLLEGESLIGWLDGRALLDGSVQWWWSILEAFETRASGLRGLPADQRLELLGAAARLLGVGAEQGPMGRSLVAYWQLRLAVGAARGEKRLVGLPAVLTLDGAVRWALANMPASREEIIDCARERAARYREAGEGFYAGADMDFSALVGMENPRLTLLQNAERVLSALEWIDPSRVDEDLRVELGSWLSIRPHLSTG